MATFELGRIKDARAGKESFERVEGFHPADFFRYAFGITVLEGKPEKVVLEFDRSEMRYLADSPLHPSQQIIAEGTETTTVEIEVYITIELIMSILSFGKKVSVHSPAHLKQQIQNEQA